MAAKLLADADGAVRHRKSWTVPELWVVVLLLGMQVTLIWSHPQIPTQDGAAHKYSAWVYRQLQEGESPELARIFERREGWLFPNASYPIFMVGASRWLTLDQAEKLASSLYLLVLAVSFRLFFTSLGGRGWVSQILVLTLTLNFLFFMGFVSFLWGASWALLAMALTGHWLRKASLPLAGLANLCLLMAWWSHQMSFCLGLVSMVVLTATLGQRRFVAGSAVWLPAAMVVVVLSRSYGSVLSGWQYLDSFGDRLWRVISLRVATSFGGTEVVMATALGLLVLVVAIVATARRKDMGAPRPLVALGLVLLLLALIAPRGAGSGFFIDDRVAFFFWLVVFTVVGFAGKRLAQIVTVVAVIFCVVQSVLLARTFRQFNEDHSILMAAADQLPQGAEVFAYSSIGDRIPGVVEPFANPNPRLALATRSPNYYHYQADPRHCANFLVCYTEEGLSRYVGERTFRGIHPSGLVGFLDHVVVWGRARRAKLELEDLYGFKREFQNTHLRIYGSSEVPLEKELAELRRVPDPGRRRVLAQRVVEGRGLDRRIMEPDRVVIANVHADGWTRGTRPAALVVINHENDPWVPVLKVRGPPEKNNLPMTVFVDDGEVTESHAFTGRSQRITLSPVAPGSMRLFAVWADRGWCLEKGYTPRRLGVRLVKVLP